MYQGLASDVIILDNCLLPLNESELVKSLTNYEALTHLQVAVSLSDTPGHAKTQMDMTRTPQVHAGWNLQILKLFQGKY